MNPLGTLELTVSIKVYDSKAKPIPDAKQTLYFGVHETLIGRGLTDEYKEWFRKAHLEMIEKTLKQFDKAVKKASF
jgi:hypothetical protein